MHPKRRFTYACFCLFGTGVLFTRKPSASRMCKISITMRYFGEVKRDLIIPEPIVHVDSQRRVGKYLLNCLMSYLQFK